MALVRLTKISGKEMWHKNCELALTLLHGERGGGGGGRGGREWFGVREMEGLGRL